MINVISLTPGFSPVMRDRESQNRFNGLSRAGKPLKRLARLNASATRLKPGVNESHCFVAHFHESQ
jgi:hypothetical protein